MNSSLGALIDEFGYSKVTTLLSLTHFNKTQAENIKKYFAQYKKYISA
jgi:hypothetical protein